MVQTKYDDSDGYKPDNNQPKTMSVGYDKNGNWVPSEAKTYKISSPSGQNQINVQKFTVSDKRDGNVQPIRVERYSSDQGPTKVSGERMASD